MTSLINPKSQIPNFARAKSQNFLSLINPKTQIPKFARAKSQNFPNCCPLSATFAQFAKSWGNFGKLRKSWAKVAENWQQFGKFWGFARANFGIWDLGFSGFGPKIFATRLS